MSFEYRQHPDLPILIQRRSRFTGCQKLIIRCARGEISAGDSAKKRCVLFKM
jgi:hypothetical protein